LSYDSPLPTCLPTGVQALYEPRLVLPLTVLGRCLFHEAQRLACTEIPADLDKRTCCYPATSQNALALKAPSFIAVVLIDPRKPTRRLPAYNIADR